MTKGAETLERNRYKLINRQPGPRGFHTSNGVRMIDPAQPGTDSGEIAELTDDEAALAEDIGLEVEPLEGVEEQCDITTGLTTPDLPAEGQFNINAPGAAEALEDALTPEGSTDPMLAKGKTAEPSKAPPQQKPPEQRSER